MTDARDARRKLTDADVEAIVRAMNETGQGEHCFTRPDGSRYWVKPGGGLRTTLAELKKTDSFWRDLVTLKRIRNLWEKK